MSQVNMPQFYQGSPTIHGCASKLVDIEWPSNLFHNDNWVERVDMQMQNDNSLANLDRDATRKIG